MKEIKEIAQSFFLSQVLAFAFFFEIAIRRIPSVSIYYQFERSFLYFRPSGFE